MNNILDFLEKDKENKLWIYEENLDIYKKYNQFYENKKENTEIDNNVSENKKENTKTYNNVSENKKENIEIDNNVSENKKENTKTYNNVSENKKENTEIDNNVLKNKKEKQYPLDVILEYTKSDPIVKQNIKDMIIIFIGKCNKIFGIKKTAEIMTGITKNSWNQSVVLFLSFFLDKTIVYKEKNYLFNENKNNGIIIIK